MASRPVFVVSDQSPSKVRVIGVEFTWFPGMSVTQKRRSIRSLHENAMEKLGLQSILEISSKSELELGRALSAFNLSLTSKRGRKMTVEGVFQGSKVFQNGGPYKELFYSPPREAKKDPRLKDSGELICFRSNDVDWPLEPKTLFYDWIYLKALNMHPKLAEETCFFEAFTDIEFNPKVSVNCQAHSAALYVQLRRSGLLDRVISSAEVFMRFFTGKKAAEFSEQPYLL